MDWKEINALTEKMKTLNALKYQIERMNKEKVILVYEQPFTRVQTSLLMKEGDDLMEMITNSVIEVFQEHLDELQREMDELQICVKVDDADIPQFFTPKNIL